jgi:hypothetical protein
MPLPQSFALQVSPTREPQAPLIVFRVLRRAVQPPLRSQASGQQTNCGPVTVLSGMVIGAQLGLFALVPLY